MYLIFDTETTGLPKNWKAPITDTDNWPRCVQIAWQLHDEMGELVVSYEKNALNINEIIKFINDQNIKLLDISTDDGDLEDVFIRLTKNYGEKMEFCNLYGICN